MARKPSGTVLIVDDESGSDLMRAVRRRLESDGLKTVAVEPDVPHATGDDFEDEALHAIDTLKPDAVLLDVRFGEHADDQFKGLGILARIVKVAPDLPVLVFTQYARGPYRDTAVAGALRVDAPVDFIDKLASPDEVALRLRRLIGSAPETLQIGADYVIDADKRVLFAVHGGEREPVRAIQGMKFDILLELANAWYRSPGELVPFWRLERFSEGDDSRASLRVRIREIKDAMGPAVGKRLGPDDLIVNVRNRGYMLVVPK